MKLSDENVKFVEDMIAEVGGLRHVVFEVIGMDKAKTLFKITKANPTAEYLAEKPINVCIYIYEEAFDMLSDEQKKMLIEDLLLNVKYDFDKDKVSIGAPSICVTCEGRGKYGDILVNAAEAGVLAIQQIEDRERQRREEQKALKEKKKGSRV